MTTIKRIGTALLASPLMALVLLAGGATAHAQYAQPGYAPPPPPPYAGPYGNRGWDAPPGELRDFQRRGFMDGVTGAEKDWQNHRFVNVRNRAEYRHPHVPADVVDDYRDGFRRGYYTTARHYQAGFVEPRY